MFTDKIISRMQPGDILHLVEFDEVFCQKLRKKYTGITNVKIFHKKIEEFSPSDPKTNEALHYDYIISGLPLNAFESANVTSIFNKFSSLSKPTTVLSYFDYPILPQIEKLFVSEKKRKNLDAILQQKTQFFEQHRGHLSYVLRNAPPARVVHHYMSQTR